MLVAIKSVTKIVGVLLIGFATYAAAETYSNSIFTLDVPDGFEAAAAGSPGPGMQIAAYVKPHPGIDGGTLFQITTYEFGPELESMPEEERGNASDYYLNQYLEGVARKRTLFDATPPTRITLGGLPASRAEWTGETFGTPLSGVMYVVVIGTTVVNLHTQDVEGAPPENRKAAMEAFEGLRLKNGS